LLLPDSVAVENLGVLTLIWEGGKVIVAGISLATTG
jgi:hypothetical protein